MRPVAPMLPGLRVTLGEMPPRDGVEIDPDFLSIEAYITVRDL